MMSFKEDGGLGPIRFEEHYMKKLVEVQEVTGEGLISLLGEQVVLFCLNYIYAGRLIGVNETCVLLNDAKIVYETGPLTDKNWKDAQPFSHPHYVMLSAIESFGKGK